MTPEVALGRAITVMRAAKALKRKDLAAAAHISYPYLSGIEIGEKEPSFTVLREIASALDMKPSALLVLAERLQQGDTP